MKLAIFILLFTVFQVSASSTSGQNISLSMNNTDIKNVLKSIERDGSFRFLFNSDLKDIKKKVSVSIDNQSIVEVLATLFSETNLTYKLLNNNLVVVLSTNAAENKVIKITGRITGEKGEALAGASVLEKGTSKGVSTDNNGIFTLTVDNEATLVIKSLGYENLEVKVNGRSVIDVKLTVATKIMDEVVVIGYGSANKRDLTGSIVKIAGKEVADKPNSNPIASLQSKVAGLYVVNNGDPGSTPDIRIRGTVSIGQVHPLYVVDGIFNDNIDYINPNDIESIEVLKDPSSLAIFGVKGATGVIAITTKKAKAGQTVINFNSSYGFKKLVDKIQMADAAQFNTLFAEENKNNGISTPDYSALNANTDWINAVTRVGSFSNTGLSVMGSSEKNRFNFGLNYISDQGIVKEQELSKINISLSDEFKVNKSIKLGVNFNTTRTHNPYDATWVLDAARKVMPQVSALPQNFSVADPYTGVVSSKSLYSGLDVALQSSGVINPLLVLNNEANKTNDYNNRYVGSVYTDINFLRYFNFRATWYGDISNQDKRHYTPLYYAYNPLNNTPYLASSQTAFSENVNDWKKFQQDYILTFKRVIGDHSLTAIGGFTTYYSSSAYRQTAVKQGTDAASLPIPNDPRFWYVSSGPWGVIDPTNTNSSQSEYSTASLLGRVLYNYKSKYFLNASIRNDASSQIPVQNRNQLFWALGGAWEISQENFMKNQKAFDYLKLKASVGVLGNQTSSYLDGTPIPYPAYPNLNTGINAVFGTNIYGAAQSTYIANPDLKWETVNASEIGIEANAFNNRLHVEINYYNKVTNNLMTYVSRAAIGLKDELINGGSLKNWGEEFSATWNQKVNKDFSVSFGGNITFMKNQVLSLAKDIPTGILQRLFMNNGSAESRTMVGQPIGSFYGYTVAGLYQSYADVLASPVASSVGAYRPGDLKFKDIASPGGVTPDGTITADDRSVIGNPSPKFMYGGSVNLTYKRFTLGVDVGGVYGNSIFRTWGSLESPFQRVNYAAFKMDRWHGAGTSNWEPIISQADRINYNGSTYNIEDGSYFRIRNLQLGYSLDPKFLAKCKINNLRLFANVQNLKTWKHNKGYSPEYGGDATAFGYDNGGGALPMITTFGLNVTF